MKNLLFSLELFLESVLMFILIVMDTLILYLLQLFNPTYGQNSSDHAAELLMIVQKFESIAEDMQSINTKKDAKMEDSILPILDLFSDYVFQLNKMHYCLWHIIVHG